MIKFADIALVPPAIGIIVNASAFPIGLFILNIEFGIIVEIIEIPIN
jgi:hypothetical protein